MCNLLAPHQELLNDIFNTAMQEFTRVYIANGRRLPNGAQPIPSFHARVLDSNILNLEEHLLILNQLQEEICLRPTRSFNFEVSFSLNPNDCYSTVVQN